MILLYAYSAKESTINHNENMLNLLNDHNESIMTMNRDHY